MNKIICSGITVDRVGQLDTAYCGRCKHFDPELCNLEFCVFYYC